MAERKDTPETDALVLKAASGAKLTKDEIKALVDLKYLEHRTRYGKEILSRTWDLDRRVTAIKREKLEEQSLALVRKAIEEIQTKLPGLKVEVAEVAGRIYEAREGLEKYLSDWGPAYRFNVRDGKTGIDLRISERVSNASGYGNRNPLGTFDCVVGNWDNSRRFAARKSGIPVDLVVEEIKLKLADEKRHRAHEAKRQSAMEDAAKWATNLHMELGIKPSVDGRAGITVAENGDVTVALPEKMTREQAEKLLRFARELGL
jgi:hypothetical protein